MNPKLLWLVGWACGATACAGPELLERGPQQLVIPTEAVRLERTRPLEVHALEAPSITVVPPSASVDGYRKGTVVTDDVGIAGLRTMILATDRGRVSITYRPPGGQALPVKTGTSLRFRWYPAVSGEGAQPDGDVEVGTRRELFIAATQRPGQPELRIGGLRGWSLILRDSGGRMIAAIFSGVEVTLAQKTRHSGTLEAPRAGVSLHPQHHSVVYEQVRRVDSGCQVDRAHRAVRASELLGVSTAVLGGRSITTGATFDALPGTWRYVTLQGRRYRLVVMDASAVSDSRCGQSGLGHFSVALLLDRRRRAR